MKDRMPSISFVPEGIGENEDAVIEELRRIAMGAKTYFSIYSS